jgi:hypothetical protein
VRVGLNSLRIETKNRVTVLLALDMKVPIAAIAMMPFVSLVVYQFKQGSIERLAFSKRASYRGA